MLPAQPNQSLMDGLACLQALAARRDPIGSRELARLLRLDPTRVNRLLKTLAAIGLAEQDERRKYRPGPAIHVLAAQSLFGSGLIRRALAPLRALHEHGYIVAMGVLWRDQTCYLYHAAAASALEQSLEHGLYPAAVSGIGMALLAHQSNAEIRALYAGPSAAIGDAGEPPVLDGEGGLLERLHEIRNQGYSLVRTREGHRTLAVPLGSPPYAAIGFSGHIPDDDVPKLVHVLRQAVEQINDNEVST